MFDIQIPQDKVLGQDPMVDPSPFQARQTIVPCEPSQAGCGSQNWPSKKENLQSNHGSSPGNFPTSDAWALTRPAAWPRSPNFETSVAPWAPYLCINIAADLEYDWHCLQVSIDNFHPPVQPGHAVSGPIISLLHLLFCDDPLNTCPSGHCFLRNSS